MASLYRFRVGIEFGATHSAVSWARSPGPDEVNIVGKWPSAMRNFDKVPSEISYTSAGEVSKWGYQIAPGEERIISLRDSVPLTANRSHSTPITQAKSDLPASKTAVDVVGDYLSCLRTHTLQILRETYEPKVMDVSSVEYVFTVPATWTAAARALLLRTAEVAGFGDRNTIQLMTEGEAVLVHSLLLDSKRKPTNIHDTFITVDCGRAAVSLTPYEVSNTISLEVRECGQSTSGIYGLNLIDKRFESLVKSRIGERFRAIKPKLRKEMLQEFLGFLNQILSAPEDDDMFTFQVFLGDILDDPEAKIEDGYLYFATDDLRDLLNPILDQINLLIKAQINNLRHVDQQRLAIILIGEFGSSQYLLQRLKGHLENIKDSPHEIFQPINPWTSCVALGASLGRQIFTRRSKLFYGTEHETKFVFGKHPRESLFYCPYTGEARCRRRIQWHIKTGDPIIPNRPIAIPFCRRIGLDDPMKFTDIVYSWKQPSAPEYPTQQTETNVVNKVCTVVTDLSAIPKSVLSEKEGATEAPHYEINYTMVMEIGPNDLEFNIECLGKVYDTLVIY